jgi:hypothetical protein
MNRRILLAASATLALVACSSGDNRQSPSSQSDTSVIAESTTTDVTTTTIDPRIVELEEKVKELERKAAATTAAPRVVSRPAETSPQTTAKPVYLERTEVRTVSKVLPNGPWSCRREYIYSDGKRTFETFSSPTECRQ